MPSIKKIDHLVLTTANPEALLAFYEKLGFTARQSGGRYELFAGDFKINVHLLGSELEPHALNVHPGSADLCFEVEGDLPALRQSLLQNGIAVEQGPVVRNGAHGEMTSLYLRDPDGGLVEISRYNK